MQTSINLKAVIALNLFLLVLSTGIAGAEDSTDSPGAGLGEMSLEELMDIKVTSVSKKSERLSEAAAAIYVLSGDEIRQSGVTNIPDALRMVPGLHVANIDASTWAVSARGFNANFSNKLLVLVDGRTVYSPLFSGVWWDVQDVMMESIDRIEVIRGPGATLWGANAVNGVINIITQNTEEASQTVVSLGTGSESRALGSLQYSGRIGRKGHFRAYGKYFENDDLVDSRGGSAKDGWNMSRGGFRYDVDLSPSQSLRIHGDLYNGAAAGRYNVPSLTAPYLTVEEEPTDLSGGNIVSRWSREGESSSTSLQLYLDGAVRRDFFIDTKRYTMDFEFQHSLALSNKLDMMWGVGHRMSSDQISTSYVVQATPEKSTYDLSNAFVQWDMVVVPNALRFTIGSKLEHNDFTGYELQPNARMVWTPHDRHTVWSAVARAIRTPGRGERDLVILVATVPPLLLGNETPFPMKIVMDGNNENQSESMIAYEAGYRFQAASNLVFDLAAYYNVYQDLMNGVVGTPILNAPEYILVPVSIVNENSSKYYGSELAVDWQMGHDSKVRGTYSYLRTDLGEVSQDLTPTQERAGPEHQFSLALFTSPRPWLDFSTRVRYVDEVASANIDAYATADVRIAIKPHAGIEFAIIGQDLADAEHPEYVSELLRQNSQVQRRVHATLKLSF